MPVVIIVAILVVVVGHCCVARKGQSSPPPAPPNLIFVTITLFIALTVCSPATHVAIAIALPPLPSLLLATLIAVIIALAALALALIVTRKPIYQRHCPPVDIAVAIALTSVACPPPVLPLPLL
jgi:hypothetical protein